MTERLIGLAYACALFHSGQSSRGYRLLSRIQWCPRGDSSKLLPREEYMDARNWAAHYIKRARKNPRLF